jgi:hypothetical protein
LTERLPTAWLERVRMLRLSRHSRILAAVLLFAFVTIEYGGYYLVRVVSGQEAELTEFQLAFSRAGHAHAGVLVTLGLVGLILADATGLTGFRGYLARHAVPIGALLMAVGFFLSSSDPGATEPNSLIVLVWIGAVSLAIGVITLAMGLFTATDEPAPSPTGYSQRAGIS